MHDSDQQAQLVSGPARQKARIGLALILTILALLSLLSIAQTIANYVGHRQVMRSVDIKLEELLLTGEEEHRVSVSFSLANSSPVDVRVEDFGFKVYLNGDYVGISDDVPFTPQVVNGHSTTEVTFAISVHPTYGRFVREAQSQGQFDWLLLGTADFTSLSQGRSFQLAIRAPWQE
jgi:LEA14-like dessication related protein